MVSAASVATGVLLVVCVALTLSYAPAGAGAGAGEADAGLVERRRLERTRSQLSMAVETKVGTLEELIRKQDERILELLEETTQLRAQVRQCGSGLTAAAPAHAPANVPGSAAAANVPAATGDGHTEQQHEALHSLVKELQREVDSAMVAAATANPAAEATTANEKECLDMVKKYNVKPGVSWGSLPNGKQERYKDLDCDKVDPSTQERRSFEANYMRTYVQTINAAVATRPAAEVLRTSPAEDAAEGPVIAIGVATTTRASKKQGRRGRLQFESFSLPKYLLPSIAKTAEPGFKYRVYIAYDHGDEWYDVPANREAVHAWFAAHVTQPLAKRGIPVQMALTGFDNPLHKPGPVFNFMMMAAYEDGAEYLYRINDDTEFNTKWATQAVAALRGYSPPNVGVVGPFCKGGNTKIMTHDLVHRTHVDVHGLYYPAILTDWWMDDWISHVYGAARTQQGPFEVTHHLTHAGTRYEVDFSHKPLLEAEEHSGQAKIRDYLKARGFQMFGGAGGEEHVHNH